MNFAVRNVDLVKDPDAWDHPAHPLCMENPDFDQNLKVILIAIEKSTLTRTCPAVDDDHPLDFFAKDIIAGSYPSHRAPLPTKDKVLVRWWGCTRDESTWQTVASM